MKNQADYSLYKCPYSHIEKECGHELHGPEGYENTYGIWCACGFRGPVFCLDPIELNLKKTDNKSMQSDPKPSGGMATVPEPKQEVMYICPKELVVLGS